MDLRTLLGRLRIQFEKQIEQQCFQNGHIGKT